jgi:transposase InsO family protein
VSVLSDNGAVFTGFYRGGKVLFEAELERLGVIFKNSRPYHPQTCGKIERLHQTLKRYLARQPAARTLTELQVQLDAFAHYYNTIRPHRALDGRTPLQTYSARGSRPGQQAHRLQTPTSASVKTRSTRPAPSPCATKAACTTSASAEPTRTGPSSS